MKELKSCTTSFRVSVFLGEREFLGSKIYHPVLASNDSIKTTRRTNKGGGESAGDGDIPVRYSGDTVLIMAR